MGEQGKEFALASKPTPAKKGRDSNLELLRIVSMLLIVFHHFGAHGGLNIPYDLSNGNLFWYALMIMVGKIGVSAFVLISGYCLVNKEGPYFNWKKILRFWWQVFFYAMGCFLLFGFLGKANFASREEWHGAFFPIIFRRWWFVTTYFVLSLIYPFINKALVSIGKRAYQTLVIIMVVIWSIIPSLTGKPMESNFMIWMFALYVIGGYLKMYGLNPRFKWWFYLIMCLLFSGLTYLTFAAAVVPGFPKIDWFAAQPFLFFSFSSILAFLVALNLFMLFASINIGQIKWINVMASATFGIYLIHDNAYVSAWLWGELVKPAQYQDSPLLIPYSIGITLAVFIACGAIELIRKYTLEKGFMFLVDKLGKTPVVKPFIFVDKWFRKVIFGDKPEENLAGKE